ncbi:hypothetical protein AB6864_05660 [Serratia proteamaculans]|nr:hypothetical protein [Serratia proteamaculans]
MPLPTALAVAEFSIDLVAGRQARRDPALAWLCDTIARLSFGKKMA